jgi:hypothetical protein
MDKESYSIFKTLSQVRAKATTDKILEFAIGDVVSTCGTGPLIG